MSTPRPGLTHLAPSRRYPKGGWLVRYRDDRNATLRKTFATKAEAESFQAKAKTEKDQGRSINPRRASTPFTEVARNWLTIVEKQDKKPKTLAGYAGIVNGHLIPFFGSKPVSRITAADVERLLAEVGGTGGTKRNVLRVLSPIMRHAVKDKMVTDNPCQDVDKPKVVCREMPYLTAEQVRQLAEEITPQYRSLILTAAYTGMRAGELAALRRRNLDLAKGAISVKESVADVAGTLHYGTTKTGKVRTVAIPRFIADLLTNEAAAKEPNGLVFTGPHGAPLRHGNYYQRHFRPAVKRLVERGDWPEELARLRFHDLRHTHAAILISRGVHPKVVSDRLGHSSISITMDRYGHLYDDHDEAVASDLNALYEQAVPSERTAQVVALPADR